MRGRGQLFALAGTVAIALAIPVAPAHGWTSFAGWTLALSGSALALAGIWSIRRSGSILGYLGVAILAAGAMLPMLSAGYRFSGSIVVDVLGFPAFADPRLVIGLLVVLSLVALVCHKIRVLWVTSSLSIGVVLIVITRAHERYSDAVDRANAESADLAARLGTLHPPFAGVLGPPHLRLGAFAIVVGAVLLFLAASVMRREEGRAAEHL